MHIPTIIAAAAMAAAASAQPVPHQAVMKTGTGKAAGSVSLFEAPKGVLLKVELTGMAPGWHAIHVHEKGDCSDAAFKSAGGHVHSATPVVHGLLNPQGNDQGDLPNIYVAADGTAKAELFTTTVALSGGAGRANLLDADGSSLIVHARPDDHQSQPIGGAGDRVACGVVH